MNYCTHDFCRMQAAVNLWWLSLALQRRRQELVGKASIALRSEVHCMLTHRKQFEGAIEYDSWDR